MKDIEQPSDIHSSADELIECIKTAVKGTKMSLQGVLNVARCLLVHENGEIKTRAQKRIVPEVGRYGIGERNLRTILEILRKLKIIRTEGRRTIPLERANELFEFLQKLPEEPPVDKDVWSTLKEKAKRDGHDPRELFAVVKHLFILRGAKIRCRGRERVVKETVDYNIGGRKLRKYLDYLEQEGITSTPDKTRYPTARGEQLYRQLEQGQITAELPPRSDRLTKQVEAKKGREDQYLTEYQKRHGDPPDEEIAKQFLVEIWNLPAFSRKDLVNLLKKKTGVDISGASLSRYKLGQRTMPKHICAALHEIYIQLNVTQLEKQQKEQQDQLAQSAETVRNALRELFESGILFPELSKKLELLGLNIPTSQLAHMSRGTQKILPYQISPILELYHEIVNKYPVIPSGLEIADIIGILNDMGYSTDKLARLVHGRLPSEKKKEIQFSGVSKALREFKKKSDRKKPIPLSFRLAIKQVYDELLMQPEVVIDKPIQKITEELQKFDLPVDPRRTQFTEVEIRRGLAIVLVAKRLQEFFYGEFKDRRIDRSDLSRQIAPIGSRRIAAFARAKGMNLTYNHVEQLQRILEQWGALEQGWLSSEKIKWIDNVVPSDDLFCLEIFHLSRIKGLDYPDFQQLLSLLKRVKSAPQAAIADFLEIRRKTFYTTIANLERYQVVKRDTIGDLHLTSRGEQLTTLLSREIDELYSSYDDLKEQLVVNGKKNNYKAALSDILFEYFLKHFLPDYQVISSVKPVGEHGIDRVLKKEDELIGVELKARVKKDPIWRNEKTFRILLRHMKEIERDYGTLPHHMLLITTADTSRPFQMIAYRVSQQMKTYRSIPTLRYTQKRLADGMFQMRFLYDFMAERWLRSEKSLEHANNNAMRNKKWFEVFIIGEQQIHSIITDNKPVQELLMLLQTNREKLTLPESTEAEFVKWRERIQFGTQPDLRANFRGQ